MLHIGGVIVMEDQNVHPKSGSKGGGTIVHDNGGWWCHGFPLFCAYAL